MGAALRAWLPQNNTRERVALSGPRPGTQRAEGVELVPKGGGGRRQVLEGKGPKKGFLWRGLPWKRGKNKKANCKGSGAATWLTCKLQFGL